MLVTSALHMQDLCTDIHKSLQLWYFDLAEGEKQPLPPLFFCYFKGCAYSDCFNKFL